MQNNYVLNCFFGLSLGFVSTAFSQQNQIVETIAPGQVIRADESFPTEAYVVIEDRLIDERPLIGGVLQGTIIEKSVPLASELIDSENSAVVIDGRPTIPAATTTPAIKDVQKDQYGVAIAEVTERNAKLEAELKGLKELLQKHIDTAGQQHEEVAAKLAEAIKERDEARAKFEASLKEYATRNEQVATLAVGLREAYERLEAKRTESGDEVEKSMAIVGELQKQIARIATDLTKHASQTDKAMDRVEGVAKQLQSIQSETGEHTESVEALKKLVSTLEERVKKLETNRGKAKPKKDE